ncbi:hypothetical protein DP939_27915 [Spongiactinospora rosea]|uniref:Uncharacterized protein n=1 Tax=Spongiactinospora rosea TaxID=2248750 RepID=A0A366LSF8_9ACTN|nr:DUF6461 domain-containing protein [Spongiactinospora rosea]RBQ16895.1 hypothetical protein DP939_27915 [Spongiactinospora rosea]
MTRATAQDFLWWEDFQSSLGISGFCFTLVAGLQPAEVLQRLAVNPDEPLQAEGYIEVGPAEGGSVIVEPAGYMGIMRDAVRPLSAGTVLASVHNNIDQHARFIYAADGKVITGLDPMFPDEPRWGAEPDRLLPDLEDLGLADEFDEDEEWQEPGEQFVEAALALAERCTGIRLTPEQVRGPLPYAASVAHLYEGRGGRPPALAC